MYSFEVWMNLKKMDGKSIKVIYRYDKDLKMNELYSISKQFFICKIIIP